MTLYSWFNSQYSSVEQLQLEGGAKTHSVFILTPVVIPTLPFLSYGKQT